MPKRVNGLPVFLGIVVLGLLSGAVYYHYKAPKLAAELQEQIDAAPKTPEGRLEQWHLFGAPQIHHRLSKFGRFSEERPWLVTHAVAGGAGEDPELWGVDCARLPEQLSHIEGMTIVVELPEPRALGRAPLAGNTAHTIPVFEPGEQVPDPAQRLRELAFYLLESMPVALGRDIDGAAIEIRVVGSEG